MRMMLDRVIRIKGDNLISMEAVGLGKSNYLKWVDDFELMDPSFLETTPSPTVYPYMAYTPFLAKYFERLLRGGLEE